jgi:cytochrome P450
VGDPVEIDNDRNWADLRQTYDALRSRCAVAHKDGKWVILRHAEVVAAATDPGTFSSRVTARRDIPNTLDDADHAAYRAVVERYLTDERVALEEEQCRGHAIAIVDALPRGVTVKTIASIGIPFAVRSQSSWLGWPPDLEDELVEWIRDNHAATRSGDRDRTTEVADRFDRMIHGLLDARRDAPPTDVTGQLMNDTVNGRPLTDEEIVSTLRNWTAGDLGSLATSVGVIVHFLADNPEIQQELRTLARSGECSALEAAVEEILRIDDPFVSNRRVATRAVGVGGEQIPEGGQVLLNWTAANRDPLAFGDPDRYDPARNAEANLVFGIGPHACPGRSLTLMELQVILEELLGRTRWIEPAPDRPAIRETPPVGGWARVPVVLR